MPEAMRELPFRCPDCGGVVMFYFDFVGGVGGACSAVARVYCSLCGRVFAEREGYYY